MVGSARVRILPGFDFLDFESLHEFPVMRLLTTVSDASIRVECAMEALAAQDPQGRGRLRVVAVRGKIQGRAIYSAMEPVPDGRVVADLVRDADGRPCDSSDFVFPMSQELLSGNPSDEDVLRAAIHNVAVFVAATGSPTARPTVYVSACVALLGSMGSSPRTRSLADDFLRMWLRSELGQGGDPPEWGYQAVERLRAVDPWAAAFMEGLGQAAKALQPLELPASLSAIADAAEFLRAHAILASMPSQGNA